MQPQHRVYIERINVPLIFGLDDVLVCVKTFMDGLWQIGLHRADAHHQLPPGYARRTRDLVCRRCIFSNRAAKLQFNYFITRHYFCEN